MLYFEKESYRDCVENFVLDLEDSLGRIQDEGEHYCSDFSFHFEYLKKGISRIKSLLSQNNSFFTYKANKEMKNMDFFIEEYASYLNHI